MHGDRSRCTNGGDRPQHGPEGLGPRRRPAPSTAPVSSDALRAGVCARSGCARRRRLRRAAGLAARPAIEPTKRSMTRSQDPHDHPRDHEDDGDGDRLGEDHSRPARASAVRSVRSSTSRQMNDGSAPQVSGELSRGRRLRPARAPTLPAPERSAAPVGSAADGDRDRASRWPGRPPGRRRPPPTPGAGAGGRGASRCPPTASATASSASCSARRCTATSSSTSASASPPPSPCSRPTTSPPAPTPPRRSSTSSCRRWAWRPSRSSCRSPSPCW